MRMLYAMTTDTVRVADVTTTLTQHVSVTLDGAVEPLMADHSKTRRIRPQSINITYQSIDGEPWTIGDVRVWGPVVKKDGSDSQTSAKATFSRWGTRSIIPGWLAPFVQTYKPTVTEVR